MQLSDLTALRKYVTIRHHIPGRIRVVFDPSLANRPEVRELLRTQNGLPPGVLSFRVNALAASVIIEYEAERINPALLEELLRTEDDQLALTILQELIKRVLPRT